MVDFEVRKVAVRALEARFTERGTWSGRELLLPPADAVAFADEVNRLGIGILGLNFWFGPHCEYIGSPDYSAIAREPNFVDESVRRAGVDIAKAIPEGVRFVSFVLETGPVRGPIRIKPKRHVPTTQSL